MLKLTLVNYRFNEIHLHSDFAKIQTLGEIVDLQQKLSFKIRFNDAHNAAEAIFNQVYESKADPEAFHVTVEIFGQFECGEKQENDIELHIQAYYMLFPYVQTVIRNLSIEANLPPLVIVPYKLTEKDIERNQKKEE